MTLWGGRKSGIASDCGGGLSHGSHGAGVGHVSGGAHFDCLDLYVYVSGPVLLRGATMDAADTSPVAIGAEASAGVADATVLSPSPAPSQQENPEENSSSSPSTVDDIAGRVLSHKLVVERQSERDRKLASVAKRFDKEEEKLRQAQTAKEDKLRKAFAAAKGAKTPAIVKILLER